MLVDVLLAAGIGLTQLAITIYALIISIKEGRFKSAVIVTIAGFLGVALTVAAVMRNRKNQDALMATITGGDSFCYLVFDAGGSDYAIVTHAGEYPLHGASARIFDLQKYSELSRENVPALNAFSQSQTVIQLGDLTPHESKLLGNLFQLGERKDLNINFNALNGFWTEELRIRRVAGKIVNAVRVTKTIYDKNGNMGTGPPWEKIDKDFPRNSKGEVDWNAAN